MVYFEDFHVINELILSGNEAEAREKIIRLIDVMTTNNEKFPNIFNDLIRQVGLYPYLDKSQGNWKDRVLLSVFSVDIGGKQVVLHREQSKLLKKLLSGKSLAVSAPTSFGKSFIVDAFINLNKPKNVVIIVPTLALTDEIRRRIQQKFGGLYKIITTANISLSESNIFIFPQERALSYVEKIDSIDLLIVDEFYKASYDLGDERSASLQRAMLELQAKSKQRYYLAPNINKLKESVFTKGIEFVSLDCNTVVLEVNHLYKKINDAYDKNMALVDLIGKISGKTLIYVNSHKGIKDVGSILRDCVDTKGSFFLKLFSLWLKKNYDKDWDLPYLVQRGVAIHNGNLHRSLSQLQLRIYEDIDALNIIISTSSIIEGVNTCTKNVILWSNKKSTSSLDFFSYKNIMGRSGRMFKYFVGNAYLLEEPPLNEVIELNIDLMENMSLSLDEEFFKNELTDSELKRIIDFKKKMAELLDVKYSQLKSMDELDSSEVSTLQKIAGAILSKPHKFLKLNSLNSNDTKYWESQLKNILYTVRPANLGVNYDVFVRFVVVLSNNWYKDIPTLMKEMQNFDFDINDFFKLEKTLSYVFSGFLSSLNVLYVKKYPQSNVNIGKFIERVSHAFLPYNVFFS